MIQEILRNSSPVYPLWAVFMLVLSLILVNKEEYKYLFPHGLLGGVTTSIILIIFIKIIKSWKYTSSNPYIVLGVPIFIVLAWFAAKIIFLWGLPKKTSKWVIYLYIGLFAILGAAIDYIFHNLGLRPYAKWYRAWMWFFVLFLNFWISYKIYLLRKKYLD